MSPRLLQCWKFKFSSRERSADCVLALYKAPHQTLRAEGDNRKGHVLQSRPSSSDCGLCVLSGGPRGLPGAPTSSPLRLSLLTRLHLP